MPSQPRLDPSDILVSTTALVNSGDLEALSRHLEPLDAGLTATLLERLPITHQAIVFRLLPKDRAMSVFERLSPGQQSDIISGL